MDALLKLMLNGRDVDEVLAEQAEAIKALGDDRSEKTFAQKIELGYVTAKIDPIPVGSVDVVA